MHRCIRQQSVKPWLYLILYPISAQTSSSLIPLTYYTCCRLTPALGFMLIFYAGLTLYMFNGPLKQPHVTIADANCADYWWTGLLYVNNIVKPLYAVRTISISKLNNIVLLCRENIILFKYIYIFYKLAVLHVFIYSLYICKLICYFYERHGFAKLENY